MDASAAPHAGSSPDSALERLRHQVERAARTIERLREENERLAARVRELEEHPAVGQNGGGTLLAFNENPEALRRRITGFIEAIDQHLGENAPPD